jgi:hypothetical protein
MILRRTLPLLVTGSLGVGLLGFGLTGLSGAEPQLRTAQETVEREQRQAEPLMQRVNCDPDHKPTRPAPPEV